MNSDQIAQLIYLSVLLLVIGGYFVAASRTNLPRFLQQGAIWVFIFVGAVTVAGLWGDIQSTGARQSVVQNDGQTVITTPRAPDGHYYLTLVINDVHLPFVVDTGATDLVLSMADAARVGLDVENLAFLGVANTANGQTRTATVRLEEVRLGDVTDRSVRAVVNQGEMNGSLLGMNYLQKYGRIEIAGNALTLTR